MQGKRGFQTVEEAVVKLGLSCRICNQAVMQEADTDEPSRFYDQGKDAAGKCFVIAYPTKPHPSGLCYFHLKKKEGLFDRETYNQLMRMKRRGV